MWDRTLPLVSSSQVGWLIVGFGAALRAVEYFSNPALYVDEGAIALNIINRTFGGFFQTLDFNQAAPPGFLVLEKLAVLALGDSEYALRLIPFLFSIAALLLFRAAARRVLAAWVVPIALLFFCGLRAGDLLLSASQAVLERCCIDSACVGRRAGSRIERTQRGADRASHDDRRGRCLAFSSVAFCAGGCGYESGFNRVEKKAHAAVLAARRLLRTVGFELCRVLFNLVKPAKRE